MPMVAVVVVLVEDLVMAQFSDHHLELHQRREAMKTVLAERLAVITAEASALRGEVDPILLLDLERILEALVEGVEGDVHEDPPLAWRSNAIP